MSTRTSAEAVLESIEKGSSAGSGVAKTFNSLIAFAGSAGSAAVLTTMPGVGALLAATSAAALAAGQVVKVVAGWRAQRNALPPYEQFRVLFYTTCHQAYLEALEAELKALPPTAVDSDYDLTADGKALAELGQRAAKIGRTQVTYLIGVNPQQTQQPLFDAYDGWLTAVLPGYGLSSSAAYSLRQAVASAAWDRLRVLLTRQTEDAAWMRSYLALSQGEDVGRVLTTLADALTSLRDWTDRTTAPASVRFQRAWDRNRDNLKSLPDSARETMFAEDFGVREVFIAPQADYRVIGFPEKAHEVAIPAQLGALLSEREPTGDLRILCGGPGSGKSTVCRMLASALANDPAMHPVFLRLRYMDEGANPAQFVEKHMQDAGLIDRLPDLQDVPNLVLILDGFDELVMANRMRLREFFNRLTADLTSGPLRFARAIVSGRDTLFPNGDGLPTGSHVLTLKPFDAPRVAEWGEKWRALHRQGPGSDFTPEKLLPDQGYRPRPLAHLASWPLTLHLLARVHTSGSLDLGTETGPEVDKALLYSSIMADTAKRQTDQAHGKGRFDQREMRKFLRHLAWEMYSRETDSLEFSEVMPLIRQLNPTLTEADAHAINEVAIVNAPELTRGEETGFEFVHKSFSEYLVAEYIAETVEEVAFKAPGFRSSMPTWSKSDDDATGLLATVFASRLITPEVQEMLEPMLGRVETFYDGTPVAQVRSAPLDPEPLARIIERLELMLTLLAQGRKLDVIAKLGAEDGLADTPLAAFANYCAGLMIVGTATARRATPPASPGHDGNAVYFNGEPSPGIFWRCVGLLEAGGLVITDRFGERLFTQMTVSSNTDLGKPSAEHELSEVSFPVELVAFRRLHGYRPEISSAITHAERYAVHFAIASLLLRGILAATADQRLEITPYYEFQFRGFSISIDILEETGFGMLDGMDINYGFQQIAEAARSLSREPRNHLDEEIFHDYFRRIRHTFQSLTTDAFDPYFSEADRMLEDLAREFMQTVRHRNAARAVEEPASPAPSRAPGTPGMSAAE